MNLRLERGKVSHVLIRRRLVHSPTEKAPPHPKVICSTVHGINKHVKITKCQKNFMQNTIGTSAYRACETPSMSVGLRLFTYHKADYFINLTLIAGV